MYAYSYTVNYNQWSSNTSAYHPEEYRLFQSADEAKEFGDKEASRLAEYTTVKSVEVEKFCIACDGRGVLLVKRVSRRSVRTKEVPCPDCQGYGKEIVNFETLVEASN